MDRAILLFDLCGLDVEASINILSEIENPEDIFKLNKEKIFSFKFLTKLACEKIVENRDKVDEFIEELRHLGILYVHFFGENFPQKLKMIDIPPLILYYKGKISLAENFGIGIIGSRKPTVYGSFVCKDLASKLSDIGATIISGMAAGIDGIAHKASLNSQGRTIAVMGGGFDNVYPPQNRRLFEEILSNEGLVISENNHRKKTLPFMFMKRNRIISGLCEGLLVVEAGAKSGTMTTVDFALEQGKQIFAVPGNINSTLSHGTNSLIKNGAIMVMSYKDIVNEFPNGIFSKKEFGGYNGTLSDKEKLIIGILEEKGTIHIEDLAYISKINIKDLSGMLNVLEIKSIVNELGNKLYTFVGI